MHASRLCHKKCVAAAAEALLTWESSLVDDHCGLFFSSHFGLFGSSRRTACARLECRCIAVGVVVAVAALIDLHQARAPAPSGTAHVEPDPSIRCICTNQVDNMGLMICCDKCEMWVCVAAAWGALSRRASDAHSCLCVRACV